jgi:hypothetical protein
MAANEAPQGLHQQRQRPREGWPNTKAPEVRAGRGIRRARKKLEQRQKDYDALSKDYKGGAYQRPGSLKIR